MAEDAAYGGDFRGARSHGDDPQPADEVERGQIARAVLGRRGSVAWLIPGFALYLVNMGLGLCAQLLRARFGWWHHALYVVVFAMAGLAWLGTGAHALLITLAALALFPRARPHTWRHPALAAVGLLGYILAVFEVLAGET